jgi:hypothetical protein
LRAIENDLLAGRSVDALAWPAADELSAEITLQLYEGRLRACVVSSADAADELLAEIAARARSADVPFELAQVLHARSRLVGDRDSAREADAIFRRLGVRVAPPLPKMLAGIT